MSDVPTIPGLYPVTAYGAVGDGVSNDTKAIQQAIDKCSEEGGGQVLVPAGTYRSGTLYLRDNVDLHLAKGAVIRGSTNRADYNSDDAFPESPAWPAENVTGAHLIVGYRVRNISITGLGTIDGNSSEFLNPLTPYEHSDSYRAPQEILAVKDWRPGQMVWICQCSKVAVKDITLLDATYWTLLFLSCTDVHVRGLTVTNPPQTPNGDGIGIDCSRNVIVSDCNVFTGDDCITLRAKARHGVDPDELRCENVVVSNCILSTPANCIRVGVGEGTVRDCLLNNLVMVNSRIGINMTSCYPIPPNRGALMENITFSNLNIDAILALQALHGEGTEVGRGIRHVSFSNVRARVTAGAYVGGNSYNYAEDVSFRDWDIHVHNETLFPSFVDRVRYPEPVEGCTGEDGHRIIPAALYARHVDGIQTRNVRVHWEKPLQRTWLRDVWFDQCRNVEDPSSDLGPKE
jgi:polygalacturonase